MQTFMHRCHYFLKATIDTSAELKGVLARYLSSHKRIGQKNAQYGHVFIIGAGPGDAELLTVKAVKAIQSADVVLFDALVSQDVLAVIPHHVKKEFVGKRCGKHSMTQQEICQKVVSLAQQGINVVRLKGGDPALFARTCEETTALTHAGVEFAIIPGITAASGMSAYTGIPLTDRRCAQAVSFITAHFSDPKTWPDMQQLCATMQQQTVVVYMGLSRLALLSERLVATGLSAQWPVAAIENATCTNQKTIVGTVETISEQVKSANLQGPTLLVFGKVVESKQDVSLSLLQSNLNVTAI